MPYNTKELCVSGRTAQVMMNLAELTEIENCLYNKVNDLYNQSRTQDTEEMFQEVLLDYRQVHLQYSNLAENDIEALKRGLFIQWYALTEPNYLTGIANLDEQAEIKIIQILDKKVLNSEIDDELDWMLNYYLSWDWVFDRFKGFKGLDKVKSDLMNKLPEFIDTDKMNQRGQMGKYWNSII